MPLALFLLLVGIPIEYRPNVLLMLPGIAHVPGVILFGPVPFDSPIDTLATFRLPLAQVATLAAGNVIVFSVAGFIALRFWAASCRIADAPRGA